MQEQAGWSPLCCPTALSVQRSHRTLTATANIRGHKQVNSSGGKYDGKWFICWNVWWKWLWCIVFEQAADYFIQSTVIRHILCVIIVALIQKRKGTLYAARTYSPTRALHTPERKWLFVMCCIKLFFLKKKNNSLFIVENTTGCKTYINHLLHKKPW